MKQKQTTGWEERQQQQQHSLTLDNERAEK